MVRPTRAHFNRHQTSAFPRLDGGIVAMSRDAASPRPY
jgi:hypothetical protein